MLLEIGLKAVLGDLEYKTFFVAQPWWVTGLLKHFNKYDDCRNFYLAFYNFWNLINKEVATESVL